MAKKEKKEVKKEDVVKVNDVILNMIAPSGIDYDGLGTALSENVGRIYSISKYPNSVDYGWLSSLCNLEGTATTVEFIHTDPDSLINIYDKSVAEKKSLKENAKSESEKMAYEAEIEGLMELLKRLKVEKEPVGYVNTILHVQAESDKRFSERLKRVQNKVSTDGCNIKLLKNRQGIALDVIAPYGLPNPDADRIGLRNMPISTFLGGFPMSNPGLNDPGGYYLGKTKNGRMVLLNMWLRNKDRTNSNWVIFGPPGIGKSTTVKDIILDEYAFGTRIIIFDPEVEYKDLAKHPYVNGDVVDCTGGKNGRINPLQIRKAAKVKEEDLEEDENIDDYFSYENAEETSDRDLYIQQLKVFFRFYFGKEEMTAGIKTELEKALINIYEKNGITRNKDISDLKPEDYPIMEDLYHYVDGEAKAEDITDYRRNNLQKLADLLYSAGEGADQLWNGATTLETDADFVDLIISGLLEADDNVKRAQFYNIITWGWHEMSKDRQRKSLFLIDEGYLVCDEDYPELMKFIRNMNKRLRKYEGGLMFITHSVVDIMDEKVRRFGQAILDNSCYKLLLGVDGKNLEDTKRFMYLSDKEAEILQKKNRGEGIFIAGNNRIAMQIDVSNEYLDMFGSAGGR